jgi:hypothetical protein
LCRFQGDRDEPPSQFKRSGDEAIGCKGKGRRAAAPAPQSPLALLATLEPISEAFDEIEDLPAERR